MKNPTGVGYMDKQYCYAPLTSSCQSSSTSDNGNIYAVLNGIDSSRSQGYNYDNLNRISGFSNASQPTPTMAQTFNVDSFGNMNMSGTLSSGLSFSQNPNNHIDGYGYDGAGNLNQVPSPLGSVYYNFDAESKLISIGTPWSPSAIYAYDANGERVLKATSSSWTEYAYFGGVPLAENNSSGGWTDYIFANGQRIARVDPVKTIDIRFPDDSCSACAGNPVGGGDRNLIVNSVMVGSTQVLPGNPASIDYVRDGCTGTCNQYTGGAVGMVWQGDLILTNLPAGSPITVNAYGDEDYSIYADMQVSLNGVLAGDWITTATAPNYTVYPVHFYSTDHLGTTTVITNGQGALESDSDFYPYGYENTITSSADPNHYKFTGKERDSESGLDYFDARYYGSSMGRFMSPDPIVMELHRLSDPQQLNLYSYVRNNPLTLTDPSGLLIDLDCSHVSSAQCGQTVTDLNNRQGAQFQVSRNADTGILGVVGSVDASKLSGSEAELYKAVTDANNTATLDVRSFSASIDFDQYAGKGLNILDRADLNALGKVNSALPGEAIAHAAVEAYAGVGEGKNTYEDAHNFANQFFGNVSTTATIAMPPGVATASSAQRTYNFQRIGVSVNVQKIFVVPQPAASVPGNWSKYPGNLVVSTSGQKKE